MKRKRASKKMLNSRGPNIEPCGTPVVILYHSLNVLFTEAVARRCSVKKEFLEISQNSQENTCARALFLMKKTWKTLLKKRLWHRCFPVNLRNF